MQTSQAKSTQEWYFPQFRRLVAEVQFMIWEHAVNPPGIVPLSTSDVELRGEYVPRSAKNRTHFYVANMPVPTILQICHDARQIELRHYELAWDSSPIPCQADLHRRARSIAVYGGTREAAKLPISKKPVYLDFARDLFYLVRDHTFRVLYYIPRDIAPRIRYVAATSSIFSGMLIPPELVEILQEKFQCPRRILSSGYDLGKREMEKNMGRRRC
jgi:2EXR family